MFFLSRQSIPPARLSDVRGGANSIVQGGGLFSGQAVTNAAVNAPVAQSNDNDLRLDSDTKTANIAQSLGTLVWQ